MISWTYVFPLSLNYYFYTVLKPVLKCRYSKCYLTSSVTSAERSFQTYVPMYVCLKSYKKMTFNISWPSVPCKRHTRLGLNVLPILCHLKRLQWPPVRYSIIFKICAITYQAYSCKQPSYSHSLLADVKNLFSFDHPVLIYFVSLKSILILGPGLLLWVSLTYSLEYASF